MDLTSLVTVPEAPRVSGTSYPRHWDWRILESDQPLPRIKRTGNNADDDSAFGSAESAKLTEDAVTPEVGPQDDDVDALMAAAAVAPDAETGEGPPDAVVAPDEHEAQSAPPEMHHLLTVPPEAPELDSPKKVSYFLLN